MALLFQLRFDLGPRAVHEDELNAERREQIEVVGEIEEAAVGHEIAAKGDHEDLAPERVDLRSDRLEPVDETVLAGKPLAPRRLGVFRPGFSAARFFIFSNRSRVPFGCACYARTHTRKSV